MTGRFLDFGGGGTRPLPTCDRQPTRNGSIRQPEAEKIELEIYYFAKHSCGAVSLLDVDQRQRDRCARLLISISHSKSNEHFRF